jgi:hypothetical protein
MKKIIFLIPFLFILFIYSCKKEQSIEMPIEPNLTVNSPQFPALAIHIIQREWVNNENKLKTNGVNDLDTYIEQRLIELYPETAYIGMLKDAREEAEEFKSEYNQYLTDLKAYEIQNGIDYVEIEDVYQPFTTLEAEIELTNMTEEEIKLFNEYEKYAKSLVPIDRETLDSLLNINYLKGGVINGTWLISAAGIVIAAYDIWRVLQARNRAEDKTSQFYPNTKAPGQVGDAFRHVYVSMHLRRYLTEVASYLIMSGYELLNNDVPRNDYMDLHNNKVGRHNKYSLFRGDYWDDFNNWEQWAVNVRNYVNNSSNRAFMLWDDPNSPTKAVAQSQESQVDDNLVIIWKN